MISKHVVHIGQRTSIRMPSISALSRGPPMLIGNQSHGVRTRLPAASRKWRSTTAFGLAGVLHGFGRALPTVSMDAADEASMQLSNPI